MHALRVLRGGGASLLLAAVAAASCSDPEEARLKSTTTGKYDKATGKLIELTYDANKNGRIDTWTEMDGSRPLRSRIDRNEDGRLDRWEYYDSGGKLLKVGYSQKDTGVPDAWAFEGPGGKVTRIEFSSTGDESRIDKWDTYENGQLATTAFDETGDGRPDRRLTYRGGTLVLLESDPDASGHFRKRVEVK